MKPTACLAVLAILFSGVAFADTKALDGTTWKVEVVPDAMAKEKGEKAFKDSLTFAEGKVSMSACQKMGFEPSPYTASKEGDKDWSFKTEQRSETQGATIWTATIHGDDIRGKMIWTKKDGTVLTYTVKGDKAQ